MLWRHCRREVLGITGEISFNEEGDANRDSAFVKTANTESGLWDFVTVQGIDGAQ